MYYLQPKDFKDASHIAFSFSSAYNDSGEALTALEQAEKNLKIAQEYVRAARAEIQTWTKSALIAMLRKSAEANADYISAMGIALDCLDEHGKFLFPEARKAYKKLMPIMDGAFIQYRDSKGRAVIEFVTTRKCLLDGLYAVTLADAIESAEVIKFHKEYLSAWREGCSQVLFGNNAAEIKLVDKETLNAAKANKSAKKAKKTA